MNIVRFQCFCTRLFPTHLRCQNHHFPTGKPMFCVPKPHPDPLLFPNMYIFLQENEYFAFPMHLHTLFPHMRPHDCHVGATLGPHWGSITPDVMPCKLLRETLQGYYPCSFSQVCGNNTHRRNAHMSDSCNSSAVLEAAWREQS